MADAIVPTLAEARISQPDYIYTDKSPFERISARLDGIDALTALAQCAIESHSPPTKMVWEPLWYSMSILAQDIKRDLYELHQQHRESLSGAKS